MADTPYRPDIDGLRAVAVLSVVVYHALPQALPGGFTGVDIFFVISGFLITRILANQAEAGRSSLLHFYERRIRRIFPALIVVMIATQIFGYILLQPGDYQDLGRSSIWTMGFLANVFFWHNTGYFDALRETMPLLHTWSLAVEEQFYLLWPLAIFALWRWTRFKGGYFWGCLAVATLFSFIGGIHLTEVDPKAAFYLPLTRAWELTIGGALSFVLPILSSGRRLTAVSLIAPWLGAGLITWAVVFLSSESPFPGYNAALPVLGSALLILSGQLRGADGNTVVSMLSSRPFVFIGKISYSLYLWHWPVFVFFKHYAMETPATYFETVALVSLSILLATLSWRFVEQPLRYIKIPRSAVFTGGAAGSIAVVLIALIITNAQGFPARIPEDAHRLADKDTMWTWSCPEKRKFDQLSSKRCVLGTNWDDAKGHAVIWGDSHALHYAPLVDLVAKQSGYAALLYDSCPPYLDNKHIRRDRTNLPTYSAECGEEYDELVRFLERDTKINLVMFASAWAMYPKRIHGPDGVRSIETGLELMREGLLRVADKVDLTRRNIVVLTEVPQPGKNMVPCVLQSLGGVLRKPCEYDPKRLDLDQVEKIHGPANRVLRELASETPGIKIIDSTRRLCDELGCNTFINGEFIYRDTNHLRRNLELETMEQIISRIGLSEVMSPEPDRIAR